jgi:histidinol phosphatase-like PHP family hydrolase
MLYSFNDFLTQIENARQKFPNIDIWTGAEAKILPDGKLDIPDDIAREIEVICFACHSSQKNISLYEESLKQVFSDIRWKEHVRVWVHPGLFLKRFKLLDSYFSLLSELVSFAIAEGVFIEYNLRYDLPPMSIAKKVPLLGLVSGLDAHSVDEAGKLVLMREKWIGNN